MDTRLFTQFFADLSFETKRAALIGAVVSFAALFAVYDMGERLSIGGIAWVTIPIGATLLLPFLFGLFAWSRGDITDLLVVSAIGGFATGLGTFAASVKNTYEFADQFDQPWPFSFGELAARPSPL